MSRSIKKKKGPGYEYWGRRPISRNHGAIPGKKTKKWTHRLERIEGKKECKLEDEYINVAGWPMYEPAPKLDGHFILYLDALDILALKELIGERGKEIPSGLVLQLERIYKEIEKVLNESDYRRK